MKDEITQIEYIRIGNPVKLRVSNDAGIYTIRAIDGINHKVMLDGVRSDKWYPIEKIRAIRFDESIIKRIPLFEKNGSNVYICYIKVNNSTFRSGILFYCIPESNYTEVFTDTDPKMVFRYWHDIINYVACIDTHIDLMEEQGLITA